MNEDPGKAGKRHSISDWVYIALGVVVVVFLLMVTRPKYEADDLRQHKFECINNLRQIDGAKQQWAMDTKALSNAIPTWENIKPYIGRGTNFILPKCPDGGVYTIGSVDDAPACSIKGHALDH